jgi:hypothetical protein
LRQNESPQEEQWRSIVALSAASIRVARHKTWYFLRAAFVLTVLGVLAFSLLIDDSSF